MTQIYGGRTSAPSKINYPALKKKKESSFSPASSFVSSGKPLQNRASLPANKIKVRVPSFTNPSSTVITKSALVDAIPKRRSGDVIRSELEEIRLRQQHYRPPLAKAVSSEGEKERYSQICAYKGGKGLPAELLQPTGEAPFEAAARLRDQNRWEEMKGRHNPHIEKRGASKMSIQEETAQQIAAEINERRVHIGEMKALGRLSAVEETKLLGEVAVRVRELEKYEQQL